VGLHGLLTIDKAYRLPVTHRQTPNDFVLPVLSQPNRATSLDQPAWDVLLRILRGQGLLARLHAQLDQLGVLEALPDKVQDHLMAARVIASDHERMIRWEVDRVRYALRNDQSPVVLLKGAAYVAADLPPARGRLVSDIDILVPESSLYATEKALINAGWESIKTDLYDQRYYRRWMHEIPPLRHTLRQTDVDVHHAILPRTARLNPDPALLLESAQVVEGSDVRVLSAADMVLHSAAHLFHDGDLDHGLRDLLDLHDLLLHFSSAEDFWEQLLSRARTLQLQRPLFYCLRYCRKYLQTRIPDSVVGQSTAGAPTGPVVWLMDQLVHSALYPRHPEDESVSIALKHWLLYVRSHYIRMPLHLLVPHLFRKAFRREKIFEESI
jgi:hypothetical protein